MVRQLLVFLVLIASLGSRVRADLIVDSWLVGTTVSDSVGSHSIGHDTVTNPFQVTHTALRGLSSASVTYDFAWTGDEAHFDLFVTHHLEELRGTTSSSGRIFLRPMVDSFVTFSGTWEYNWPSSAIGATHLSMFAGSGDYGLQVSDHGGNVGIGPPFGTLNVSGDILLPGGSTYFLNYRVTIDHSDPTPPGTFGTGAGQLNFTITPVPEPASLTMLVLAMLSMPRKRIR